MWQLQNTLEKPQRWCIHYVCTFVHFCIFPPDLPLRLRCFTMHTSIPLGFILSLRETYWTNIGLFAFCTMTGVIALDKWGKHWLNDVIGSRETLGLMYCQHFFWAFEVELRSHSQSEQMDWEKRGFLGVLTSGVECASCGQGKAEAFPVRFACFGKQHNILSTSFGRL